MNGNRCILQAHVNQVPKRYKYLVNKNILSSLETKINLIVYHLALSSQPIFTMISWDNLIAGLGMIMFPTKYI